MNQRMLLPQSWDTWVVPPELVLAAYSPIVAGVAE
jgi:hypothetical protein